MSLLFSDAVKKAMPYLKKDWASGYLPQSAQPPSNQPPATHGKLPPEKANKERGLDDPQLIMKMQELALPAGTTAPAGGDMSSAPLQAPTTSWGVKNG